MNSLLFILTNDKYDNKQSIFFISSFKFCIFYCSLKINNIEENIKCAKTQHKLNMNIYTLIEIRKKSNIYMLKVDKKVSPLSF